MKYTDFLQNKLVRTLPTGIQVPETSLNLNAFEWQRHCISWALNRGKAALFEDCGLGKTLQQLIWADEINKATNKPILILSPLAVAPQTKAEGVKFGIDVNICENQADVKNGINITNYGHGLEAMMHIMNVVGVSRWEDLEGKYCRIKYAGWGEFVTSIGNILNDQWFDIKEFFEEKKKQVCRE